MAVWPVVDRQGGPKRVRVATYVLEAAWEAQAATVVKMDGGMDR